MRLIENPDWDFREEIIANCPDAYFVQSPRFMDFCLKAVPKTKDCSLGFIFDDGTRCFIPFLCKPQARNLFYNYESSSLGYGGLVAEKRLDNSHYREAMNAALNWIYRRRYFQISISTPPADFEIDFRPASKKLCSWTEETTNTHLIKLQADYKDVYEQFKYFRKKNIRTAERAGVEVRLLGNESELEELFLVYRDRVKRWGEHAKTNYDRRFFQTAYQTMLADKRMQIWIATHNKKIYAGAIILYQGQGVHAWLAASLEDDTHRPYSYLQSVIIKDACERGLKFYDVGRSRSEGVGRFKEAFGAYLVPHKTYQGQNLLANSFFSFYNLMRFQKEPKSKPVV